LMPSPISDKLKETILLACLGDEWKSILLCSHDVLMS
jgi:hypothetical protein